MSVRRHVRHAALVGLVASLALCSASCSLPVDHQARAIDGEKVPALLVPDSGPTTSVAAADAKIASIYLINSGQLERVVRKVNALTPESVLTQLFSGATPAEKKSQIASYIPVTAKLRSAVQRGSVLTIDLSSAMNDIARPNNTMAYAQIVFSLVKSLGVRQVAVKIDGEPTKIPSDNGQVDLAGIDDFTFVPATSSSSATTTRTKHDTAVPTPTSPPTSSS